jgi:hypothetical protein
MSAAVAEPPAPPAIRQPAWIPQTFEELLFDLLAETSATPPRIYPEAAVRTTESA